MSVHITSVLLVLSLGNVCFPLVCASALDDSAYDSAYDSACDSACDSAYDSACDSVHERNKS